MINLGALLMALAILLPFSARAEVVDKVVAIVNQEPITLYDVDRLMAQNVDEIKKAAATGDQKEKFQDFRSMALQKLIGEKLLDQELERRKIVITDADMQKSVEGIMKRNNLTDAQFKSELGKQGMTWEQYTVTLKAQLKKVKFMSEVLAPRVKVTDADLDEFFAKHPEQFAPYQSVKMAQIIIPVDSAASDSDLQAAQKRAEEISAKAKGGSNFEDLGKKTPNPQTAIPEIYQVNQLAPAIIEVLGDLQPGGVSQPVRSSMGIHVVKLYERKTLAGEEYKQVREQLREKVFEEKMGDEMDKYLDELKGKSYVEVKS